MKRTDAPYHDSNMFQDGDEGAGVTGTHVDSSWLNSVQEELAAIVENDGTALDGNSTVQVLAAINKLCFAVGGANEISGFKLSINGADPDELTVGRGRATGEGTNTAIVRNASSAHSLSATWADGGAGLLPSALTLSTNQWYRVFAIGNDYGTKQSVGVDVVSNAANLMADAAAAGYTQYRRIGWINTDGSLGIVPFFQEGDYFGWIATKSKTSAASATASNVDTIPAAPESIADFVVSWEYSGNSGFQYGLITPLETGEQAPSATLFSFLTGHTSSSFHNRPSTPHRVKLNSARQVRLRTTVASGTINISINGWIDSRGR